MFIHHFNRLIRNKWVWGVFAVIISAFFAFDFLIPRGDGNVRSGAASGLLAGEEVKTDEFRAFANDVRGYGERGRRNDMEDRQVNKAAWENIAAVKTGERLGLGVSEDEVRSSILEMPYFRGASGVFDMNVYENVLRQNGFNAELFEQVHTRSIALDKIAREVSESAAWVSPMEIDRAVQDMTDVFTVRVATFTDKSETPKLDDEVLKKYYDAHTNSLALPDLVSVRFIKFDSNDESRYTKIVISDEELQDYYDTVSARYETQTTNGVVRKTLEEVKPELVKELQQSSLIDVLATNLIARVFEGASGEKVEGKAKESMLDKIAAEEKMTVRTSPRFGGDGARVVKDLMVSAESFAPGTDGFANAAFELDPENEEFRYGVVRGTNCVFMIERASFVPAHVPTFEEAKAAIRDDAAKEAKADAFKASVEKVADAAREALKGGKAFDDSMFDGATVSTGITFTARMPGSFPNSGAVSSAARKLVKGELSGFTKAGTGKAVVVYMEDRKAGDVSMAATMEGELRGYLARMAYGDIFSSWKSWNLARLGVDPGTGYETEEPKAEEPSDESPVPEN